MGLPLLVEPPESNEHVSPVQAYVNAAIGKSETVIVLLRELVTPLASVTVSVMVRWLACG
jgi:hypothetical protein